MRVGGCVSEKAELLFIDVILAIDADIDVIALVPVSVPKHVSGIRPILFRRLGVRRGLGRTLARRGRAEELELLIIEFFLFGLASRFTLIDRQLDRHSNATASSSTRHFYTERHSTPGRERQSLIPM